MISSPAEARARVDRDLAGARERAVAAHAARTAIDAVRGRAQSRGADVQVVVDSGGSIVSLDLSPRAMSRTPEDLSHAIVQVTRQAQADVVAQVATIAADTFGEDTPTTARIRGQLDERFTKPEPDDDGIAWGSDARGTGSRW